MADVPGVQQTALDGEKDAVTERTGPDPKSVVREKYKQGLELRKSNPDRVPYDGQDLTVYDSSLIALDPDKGENPRHWTKSQKWVATIIVGVYVFLAPFTSTIFAPCLPQIMASIGVTDPIEGALQVSIFVFAFAIGPLVQAPLSEIYGRKPVLSGGNLIFIVFGVGSGFCDTAGSLAACRFFAGLGGSACLAVFGGVLADIWNLKERAKASGILMATTIMGPVTGPLCGGWIASTISWRWTCWIPAIAGAALEGMAFYCLHESFIPALLRHKLAAETKRRPGERLYTVFDLRDPGPDRGVARQLVKEGVRPIMYLVSDPAVLLLSIFFAFIFGILYLVIVTFYTVFGEGYGHSTGIVGVDLLAEGIGALIGLPITVKLLDLAYARATQVKGKEYKSETRLITAFGGCLVTAAGLFIYGFTALRTHFMVPLIGVAIFAIGIINIQIAISLYIIDSFDFPASAMAAFSTLRMVFGGAFPLFGHRLFDALGIDWGVGLLAFLTLGLGVPFLPIVYRFGPALREMGKRNRARWGA